MKTIKVEIDCTDKYCGSCSQIFADSIYSQDSYYCHNFADSDGKFIRLEIEEITLNKAKLILRSKECLEAEVSDEQQD